MKKSIIVTNLISLCFATAIAAQGNDNYDIKNELNKRISQSIPTTLEEMNSRLMYKVRNNLEEAKDGKYLVAYTSKVGLNPVKIFNYKAISRDKQGDLSKFVVQFTGYTETGGETDWLCEIDVKFSDIVICWDKNNNTTTHINKPTELRGSSSWSMH
jgi:hypothetical protein